MSEFIVLTAAFSAGSALGGLFFGGLCWTVKKGLVSANPALWFFGSMIVRMTIVLAGFYLVAGMVWQRWLACLVGFILARFVVKWLTTPPTQVRAL